jgi:hypothetical protein
LAAGRGLIPRLAHYPDARHSQRTAEVLSLRNSAGKSLVIALQSLVAG